MVTNQGRYCIIPLPTLVMPHHYNLALLMETEIIVERQEIAPLLIFWPCHNITRSEKLSYIILRIKKMQ